MPVTVDQTAPVEQGSGTSKSGSGPTFAASLEWEDDGGQWRSRSVAAFEGEEQMSSPFRFRIEVVPLSADGTLEPLPDPLLLVGRRAVFSFGYPGDRVPLRHVCGQIEAAFEVIDGAALPFLELILVPPLLGAMQNRRSRAFERRKPRQVVLEVLNAAAGSGFLQIADRIFESPDEERLLTLQYEESDFDFVSRWLEALGLRYHFEHDARSSRMVLTDRDEGLETDVVDARFGSGFSDWPGFLSFRWGSRSEPGLFGIRALVPPHPPAEATWSKLDPAPPIDECAFTTRYDLAEGFGYSALAQMDAERGRKVQGEGTTSYPNLRVGTVIDLEIARGRRLHLVERVRHVSPREGEIRYRAEARTWPLPRPPERHVTFRPARTTSCPRISGVLRATVIESVPHAGQTGYGTLLRVRLPGIELPCLVPLAQPIVSPEHGTFFLPSDGDAVLVAFADGDPDQPIVVGSVATHLRLWPPRGTSDRPIDRNTKVALASAGHLVALQDADGVRPRLFIQSSGDLQVATPDFKQTVDATEVKLESANGVVVTAGNIRLIASSIDIVGARVTLDAGLVTVPGALRCETLIANAVVAASYTPGAGNIW